MSADGDSDVVRRARVHAALGDPARLLIVDSLVLGQASPSELQALLAMPSNLLAHHVRTLERAGVIHRTRSEGDRRRTYLGLVPAAIDTLRPTAVRGAVRVVFVCTANSARSQLAAALWRGASEVPATSAGTHPAAEVHPGALAAARRHDLPLSPATPCRLQDVRRDGDVVITVCDTAHETLGPGRGALHWSVADPARSSDDAAFDRAVDDLADRVARTAPAFAALDTGDPR